MSKITINASMALDIQAFISTEKTRYYLNGFFVEPCKAGGVTIVATDGHALGCLHDPEGTIDGPSQIVRIDKTIITTIKANNKGTLATWLVIDGVPGDNTLKVVIGDPETGKTVGTFHDCMIEGTFPDWRRVVPSDKPCEKPASLFGLQPKVLNKFASISPAGKNQTQSVGVLQCEGGTLGPMLVHVSGRSDFVGVIMPCRLNEATSLPEWFNA